MAIEKCADNHRTMAVVCELEVVESEPSRDARAFEPVLIELTTFVARFELVEHGVCVFETRGPSRFFGGDERLSDRIRGAIHSLGIPCRIGVADGLFAARLAAESGSNGEIVEPGDTKQYLASLPISKLGRPDLVELLRWLGIHTLGAFASLQSKDVLARFGSDGSLAQQLAAGDDPRPIASTEPPPELTVEIELEPPVSRVDEAAFAARSLSSELEGRLSGLGLICTCLAVEAMTDHGEDSTRLWRHDEGFTSTAMVDRVRWQLEGWLNSRRRPTAGICLLRLRPDRVRPDSGRQLGLWGQRSRVDTLAERGLTRLQGLLGNDGVLVAESMGGRDPDQQIRLVPWNGSVPIDVTSSRSPKREVPVWPGMVPSPSPTILHRPRLSARVLTRDGEELMVFDNGELCAEPTRICIGELGWSEIVGWSNTWPIDERWWDSQRCSQRIRLQVETSRGCAHLLAFASGHWSAEATYD